MAPRKTSAKKTAKRPASTPSLLNSGTTTKKAGRNVASAAVAQPNVQPPEMMLFPLNGLENWPLDVEKSTCARLVYHPTSHKLQKKIYRVLLMSKKWTEKGLEKKKSEVPTDQEACIVTFTSPLFVQNGNDPADKHYVAKVEIFNYHRPGFVKITWSPMITSDPQRKKENREEIDYQKRSISTDESHRLAVNHDRLLEEVEKLRIANKDLKTKIADLEQGEEDAKETIAEYRQLLGLENKRPVDANQWDWEHEEPMEFDQEGAFVLEEEFVEEVPDRFPAEDVFEFDLGDPEEMMDEDEDVVYEGLFMRDQEYKLGPLATLHEVKQEEMRGLAEFELGEENPEEFMDQDEQVVFDGFPMPQQEIKLGPLATLHKVEQDDIGGIATVVKVESAVKIEMKIKIAPRE